MFKNSDEFRGVTWWREEIPAGRFWVLCLLVVYKFKYSISPPKIIMFLLELQKSLAGGNVEFNTEKVQEEKSPSGRF